MKSEDSTVIYMYAQLFYYLLKPFCGTLAFSFASNVSFVNSNTILENKTDFDIFFLVLPAFFMVEA